MIRAPLLRQPQLYAAPGRRAARADSNKSWGETETEKRNRKAAAVRIKILADAES